MPKAAGRGARPRIAVLCSGYGSNFQAILDAVRSGKLRADVAVMVSDNPKAQAIRRAAKAKVPVCVLSPKLFASREAHERVVSGVLKSQGVVLVVLAGYMRILTPYFVRTWKNRLVNVHPSYLPAFKGAHAIRDAFEAKVRSTGVSIHLVTNQLDSGRVLAQKKVSISRRDTLASLEKKIHTLEHKLYPAAVGKYLDLISRR